MTSSADHRYAARLTWSGSTGGGYDSFPREHHISAAGKPQVTMSADPHFRGDAALVNPEELLVMAASSCQLLSFLAVAARARLDVTSYTDEASGVMPEGGPVMSVTAIHLQPTIVLAEGSRTDRLQHLLELAHQECFIANSLLSRLIVDAKIFVGQDLVTTAHVED
ncbi:OsmC family protein [Leekyejoonella antrihumi]|uniref:OsmC family peroxiredoxin n=1 Tax=Leekyejoonella antrihumi TaxID=1660198 RepID=A0A563E0N3_9MICO|nr:OsmC family protein [Leekyejoonella antrihumi]TWP36076.1 OsmC family peroxiredoxin [Leekyejoonella antrihumi]